jgi:hypothetical protein
LAPTAARITSAVILGWWLLGEQISWHTLLAAAIVIGVAFIMLHPRETERGEDETAGEACGVPEVCPPVSCRNG